MRKILVTGAAGFIGFHLSRRLLEGGDPVVGLDNLNPYYDVTLKQARLQILEEKENFRFVRGDLSDRKTMEALFADERFEIVVNLAAQAGVRYSLKNPHAYVMCRPLSPMWMTSRPTWVSNPRPLSRRSRGQI